ncbi:extracellular solute-binding protein [Paenibacillus sp. RC67]|uniref:ABC transporter substrate-binding protein n=1 Tax=Paenibacillus sp. RC67 TaxID=3039392 RepID=UPI0024AE2570|nr:extracellular solute-binding protein [Paenibacillus sp. RC67]
MKQRNRFITAASLLIFISGCSSSTGGTIGTESKGGPTSAPKVIVDTSPVTLTLYIATGIADKDVKNLIVDPVKKKYPHITIEPLIPGQGTKIEDLVTAGKIPDLIYTWNGDLGKFKQMDLLEDMTPLAKKNNVDLGRFEPVVLESITKLAEKSELYALPFSLNFNATYYNKELFDKFGVPYPKDGMTWDEAIELGKKMSRLDNGVTYRGLDSDQLGRMSTQLSLTMVDGKANKASVNNEGWKKLFETAKRVWSLPNNTPPKMMTFNGGKWFMEDKNVAMLTTANILSSLESAEKNGLNWDVVTFPVYKENPNVYRYAEAHLIAITKSTKYKDQAMQALDVITSEEVQRLSVRTAAKPSPLKNPELKKELGADMPFLKGKNLQSVIKDTPAPAPYFSPYENDSRGSVWGSFEEYFNDTKDLNTALREADEKVNKLLDSKKK